jgi:hypothetical protein
MQMERAHQLFVWSAGVGLLGCSSRFCSDTTL